MPNISLSKAKTICICAIVAVVGVVAVVTGLIGGGAFVYGAISSASYSEMALCVANCLGNRALQPLLLKVIRFAVVTTLGQAAAWVVVKHRRANAAEDACRAKDHEIKNLHGDKEIKDALIKSMQEDGVVTATHVQNLERDNKSKDGQIEFLEAKNGLMATRMASLEDDNCEKDGRIVALKAENETMADRISALEDDTSVKDDRIVSLETQVGTLQTQFASFQSWMANVSQQQLNNQGLPNLAPIN